MSAKDMLFPARQAFSGNPVRGLFSAPRLKMYQQVYFTVIAALAIVFLITFAVLHFVINPVHRNTQGYATFAKFIADSLPPITAPVAEQASVIQGWSNRSEGNIALYSPSRQLLFAAGARKPLAPSQTQLSDGWITADENFYATLLPDHRWVVVNLDRENPGAELAIAAALLCIFILVGLGIYPVLRKITRRLEDLQHSVDELGEGNLSARVTISGEDEVGVLAFSFNRTASQLEAMVNAQKTLLANASHELRSPLARIQMALGLLGTEGAALAVEEIHQSVGELDQLIGEILLASRLESGKMTPSLHIEAIDIRALLLEESRSYRADVVCPELSVMGDRILLKRLFRNLLENAKRYGKGSPVNIVARSINESEIEISVADRGPGIPIAEQERVFDAFYRLPGTREGDGGSGLGLALVRAIAKLHGGHVFCTNRDGGGTLFFVRLQK